MTLDNNNYFSLKAQQEFMSVSQFKAFRKCQECALAEISGNFIQPKTTALLIGSYVDAYFEGTLFEFKENNPQIFKKTGELKSEYIKADEIIKRIQNDELFCDYMSGEKQVIMTGEIKGVPIKIKVDSLLPDRIVDLKVVKDFEPIYVPEQGRLSFIEAWGYDIQGAVYQEIVRQNTGVKLPFYIAAATKERVTDLEIIEITQPYLDCALDDFKTDIQYYNGIKQGLYPAERCEKCDYCKKTKVLKEPKRIEEFVYE